MQVNNVVIVGGGTSGWMTCAALLKLCPWVNVVLVESAKSKPVGVGESTLGHWIWKIQIGCPIVMQHIKIVFSLQILLI